MIQTVKLLDKKIKRNLYANLDKGCVAALWPLPFLHSKVS